MTTHKDTEFPWLRLLGYALFWCYIAMVVLAIFRILVSPVLTEGAGTELDFGQMLNWRFWWQAFMSTLVIMLEASFILIPCYYAGMFACLRIEKHNAAYEKQYETTFRVVATITFIILAGALLIILDQMGVGSIDLALDAIELVIVYYIFDDNVAEQVWPQVFSRRE